MVADVTATSAGSGIARHTLKIGTRASKLALVQSNMVRDALLRLSPGLDVQLEHITTKGDVVQDRPLSEIGGNGLFVTQIEVALRAGTVDMAVHSAKDLSSQVTQGMALAAFLPRADARDVLVSREGGATLAQLPHRARVGTSSPRRASQLLAWRPDLTVLDIRGNVDTRLRKLREGHYDAIVLAGAGLVRLGLQGQITEWLDPDVMLPAVAQGALAVEVRADDTYLLDLVSQLDDPATSTAVRAERAFLARIGGGCSLPIGAFAVLEAGSLRVQGMIGSAGGEVLRGEKGGSAHEPEQLGAALAAEMLAAGGQRLIDAEAEAR